MRILDTSLPDVKILEPEVYGDARGFFFESYNQRRFDQVLGRRVAFVQDNHSRSARGVLRGLHYQLAPHPQGKLVRVVAGAAFDVAVDVRRGSPTFGRWAGVELTAENRRQLWIPEGHAHGFLALSEQAEVLYKTTGYAHGELARTIAWDDRDLDIAWPLEGVPILSDKDRRGAPLAKAELFD